MLGLSESFEPVMSMVLATTLGAIASAATIWLKIHDRSLVVFAAALWLFIMYNFYNWDFARDLAPFALMGLAWPILIVGGAIVLGQIILGLLALVFGFAWTRRSLMRFTRAGAR